MHFTSIVNISLIENSYFAKYLPFKNLLVPTRKAWVPKFGNLKGNKTIYRQNSSPTQLFEIVPRQTWRQFPDTFGDSSPTLLFYM